MDVYERVLLVKQKVMIFRIPPLRSVARGYMAKDWNLDSPDWTGRMRLVTVNEKCLLKLEDGVNGELYAQAPISAFPGPGVQHVTDSSRYFVIRVQNDTGRTAYLGMGFSDRSDSFDLNVALHDHFKLDQHDDKLNKAHNSETTQPKLDLKLKDGINLNLNLKSLSNKDNSSSTSFGRPQSKQLSEGLKMTSGGMVLLPPPPGSGANSSSSRSRHPPTNPSLFD